MFPALSKVASAPPVANRLPIVSVESPPQPRARRLSLTSEIFDASRDTASWDRVKTLYRELPVPSSASPSRSPGLTSTSPKSKAQKATTQPPLAKNNSSTAFSPHATVEELQDKLELAKRRVQLMSDYYSSTRGHAYVRDAPMRALCDAVEALELELASKAPTVAEEPIEDDPLHRLMRRRVDGSDAISDSLTLLTDGFVDAVLHLVQQLSATPSGSAALHAATEACTSSAKSSNPPSNAEFWLWAIPELFAHHHPLSTPAAPTTSTRPLVTDTFAPSAQQLPRDVHFIRWLVLSLRDADTLQRLLLHPRCPPLLLSALLSHAPRELLELTPYPDLRTLLRRCVEFKLHKAVARLLAKIPSRCWHVIYSEASEDASEDFKLVLMSLTLGWTDLIELLYLPPDTACVPLLLGPEALPPAPLGRSATGQVDSSPATIPHRPSPTAAPPLPASCLHCMIQLYRLLQERVDAAGGHDPSASTSSAAPDMSANRVGGGETAAAVDLATFVSLGSCGSSASQPGSRRASLITGRTDDMQAHASDSNSTGSPPGSFGSVGSVRVGALPGRLQHLPSAATFRRGSRIHLSLCADNFCAPMVIPAASNDRLVRAGAGLLAPLPPTFAKLAAMLVGDGSLAYADVLSVRLRHAVDKQFSAAALAREASPQRMRSDTGGADSNVSAQSTFTGRPLSRETGGRSLSPSKRVLNSSQSFRPSTSFGGGGVGGAPLENHSGGISMVLPGLPFSAATGAAVDAVLGSPASVPVTARLDTAVFDGAYLASWDVPLALLALPDAGTTCRFGWCRETCPADGVTPFLLGEDTAGRSIGVSLSLVPFLLPKELLVPQKAPNPASPGGFGSPTGKRLPKATPARGVREESPSSLRKARLKDLATANAAASGLDNQSLPLLAFVMVRHFRGQSVPINGTSTLEESTMVFDPALSYFARLHILSRRPSAATPTRIPSGSNVSPPVMSSCCMSLAEWIDAKMLQIESGSAPPSSPGVDAASAAVCISTLLDLDRGDCTYFVDGHHVGVAVVDEPLLKSKPCSSPPPAQQRVTSPGRGLNARGGSPQRHAQVAAPSDLAAGTPASNRTLPALWYLAASLSANVPLSVSHQLSREDQMSFVQRLAVRFRTAASEQPPSLLFKLRNPHMVPSTTPSGRNETPISNGAASSSLITPRSMANSVVVTRPPALELLPEGHHPPVVAADGASTNSEDPYPVLISLLNADGEEASTSVDIPLPRRQLLATSLSGALLEQHASLTTMPMWSTTALGTGGSMDVGPDSSPSPNVHCIDVNTKLEYCWVVLVSHGSTLHATARATGAPVSDTSFGSMAIPDDPMLETDVVRPHVSPAVIDPDIVLEGTFSGAVTIRSTDMATLLTDGRFFSHSARMSQALRVGCTSWNESMTSAAASGSGEVLTLMASVIPRSVVMGHISPRKRRVDVEWRVLQQYLFTKAGAIRSNPLSAAMRYGFRRLATSLVKCPSISANLPDEVGDTPCMLALLNDDPVLLETLLNIPGVSIKPINYSGVSAMHMALLLDRQQCLDVMLRHPNGGVDAEVLDTQTPNKSTCLSLCVKVDRCDLIPIFLSRGASATKVDRWNTSPLLFACRVGNYAAAKQLLDSGQYKSADVSQRERRPPRGTALLYACMDGQTALCRRLLDIGCDDIEVGFEPFRISPLHAALLGGHQETASFLIMNGRCKVNAVEASNDDTPLHVIAARGYHALCMQLITTYGQEVNCGYANKHGCTPLMVAIANRRADVALLLLAIAKRRLRIECADKTGTTALTMASSLGMTDVCTAIIEANADLNVVNLAGYTSLAAAIAHDHAETAEAIVHVGRQRLDLNASRAVSSSPIHLAFQKGFLRLCRLMLDCGAKTSLEADILKRLEDERDASTSMAPPSSPYGGALTSPLPAPTEGVPPTVTGGVSATVVSQLTCRPANPYLVGSVVAALTALIGHVKQTATTAAGPLEMSARIDRTLAAQSPTAAASRTANKQQRLLHAVLDRFPCGYDALTALRTAVRFRPPPEAKGPNPGTLRPEFLNVGPSTRRSSITKISSPVGGGPSPSTKALIASPSLNIMSPNTDRSGLFDGAHDQLAPRSQERAIQLAHDQGVYEVVQVALRQVDDTLSTAESIKTAASSCLKVLTQLMDEEHGGDGTSRTPALRRRPPLATDAVGYEMRLPRPVAALFYCLRFEHALSVGARVEEICNVLGLNDAANVLSDRWATALQVAVMLGSLGAVTALLQRGAYVLWSPLSVLLKDHQDRWKQLRRRSSVLLSNIGVKGLLDSTTDGDDQPHSKVTSAAIDPRLAAFIATQNPDLDEQYWRHIDEVYASAKEGADVTVPTSQTANNKPMHLAQFQPLAYDSALVCALKLGHHQLIPPLLSALQQQLNSLVKPNVGRRRSSTFPNDARRRRSTARLFGDLPTSAQSEGAAGGGLNIVSSIAKFADSDEDDDEAPFDLNKTSTFSSVPHPAPHGPRSAMSHVRLIAWKDSGCIGFPALGLRQMRELRIAKDGAARGSRDGTPAPQPLAQANWPFADTMAPTAGEHGEDVPAFQVTIEDSESRRGRQVANNTEPVEDPNEEAALEQMYDAAEARRVTTLLHVLIECPSISDAQIISWSLMYGFDFAAVDDEDAVLAAAQYDVSDDTTPWTASNVGRNGPQVAALHGREGEERARRCALTAAVRLRRRQLAMWVMQQGDAHFDRTGVNQHEFLCCNLSECTGIEPPAAGSMSHSTRPHHHHQPGATRRNSLDRLQLFAVSDAELLKALMKFWPIIPEAEIAAQAIARRPSRRGSIVGHEGLRRPSTLSTPSNAALAATGSAKPSSAPLSEPPPPLRRRRRHFG